jgi:tRNA U34 5-methylaminomethyl-2-thiouridine-forming methyltransferase MnmC
MPTRFTPYPTVDGSFTFFSEEFGQTFHSKYGAKEESIYKFAIPTLLSQKAIGGRLKLLDVCYGLGYNSAAALETIWQANPDCQVELIALELDRAVPNSAIEHQLLGTWSEPIPEILTELAHLETVHRDRLQARLLYGDARQTIQQLNRDKFQADGIFLDPFSPAACPQLWTVEFIDRVAKCCAIEGRIATYSCAAAVRKAMLLAGLTIADTQPVGRKSPGTIATFNSQELAPLSLQEQEHLQTRAAIPYRDPTLEDTTLQILSRRQAEQEECGWTTTSQWKKKWERAYL